MLLVMWPSGQIPRAIRQSLRPKVAPLVNGLDWGPLHPDLAVEALMRGAYFSGFGPEFEEHRYVIPDYSDDIILWAEPSLAGCLAVLTACDWLLTAGRDLSKAALSLSPCISYKEPLEAREMRAALATRIPLQDVVEVLVNVRRDVASRGTTFSPDLTSVDCRLRNWGELVLLLRNFLPDERGLDLLDAKILEELRAGPRKVTDLMQALIYFPREYDISGIRLWERLLELSRVHPVSAMRNGMEVEEPLLTLTLHSHHPLSVVELTQFGSRVAEGRSNALKKRDFRRWVGGRYVHRENLLLR